MRLRDELFDLTRAGRLRLAAAALLLVPGSGRAGPVPLDCSGTASSRQTGRTIAFRSLFLLDEAGEVVSSDSLGDLKIVRSDANAFALYRILYTSGVPRGRIEGTLERASGRLKLATIRGFRLTTESLADIDVDAVCAR